MATRSVREITLDMKKIVMKLLDATKWIEQAERDRTLALVELLNLQKELERMTKEEKRDSDPYHFLKLGFDLTKIVKLGNASFLK